MKTLATVLGAAVAAAVLTGCGSAQVADAPPAAGAPMAAAPVPGAPPPPLVVPENYDEGDWKDKNYIAKGVAIVGHIGKAIPAMLVQDPFYAFGNITERSGYPYAGIRNGCDLFYFPTINYCKYFNTPERLTRIDRVFETDAQGFTDDWDMLWQNDRPTYLVRYYLR